MRRNQTFNQFFTVLEPIHNRPIGKMKGMSKVSASGFWPQAQPASKQHRESTLKLSLEIRVTEDATVVHCKGRIVYCHEAAALSGQVAGLLPHTRQLVLELSEVQMIDGAGLGELVVILMGAQASGCSIKLAGPSDHIRELLELTYLNSVFEIYPSLEDAIVACREQMV
jgi:anti-sigma B factor antagonist